MEKKGEAASGASGGISIGFGHVMSKRAFVRSTVHAPSSVTADLHGSDSTEESSTMGVWAESSPGHAIQTPSLIST